MPLPGSDSVITCPKCDDEHTERVSFLYKKLESKNAGKRFLLDDTFIKDLSKMTPQYRDKLLSDLMPPQEPARHLPAGTIARMAFLISWLVTSAIIVGRLGYKNYFFIALTTAGILILPFYFLLMQTIHIFQKTIGKYREMRTFWEGLYFCHDCQNVFTPKK